MFVTLSGIIKWFLGSGDVTIYLCGGVCHGTVNADRRPSVLDS